MQISVYFHLFLVVKQVLGGKILPRKEIKLQKKIQCRKLDIKNTLVLEKVLLSCLFSHE